MKKTLFLLQLALLISFSAFSQDDIVLVGQKAPDFVLKTDKGNLKLSDLKGKVVLINFFATWCGPCRTELPELQTNIWEKYKDNPAFRLMIIGREQTQQEGNEFKASFKYLMPFYADPDRSVYKLYANQYIPRNYLIDRNGVVVYASNGYSAEEFAKLVEMVGKILGK